MDECDGGLVGIHVQTVRRLAVYVTLPSLVLQTCITCVYI